MQSYDPRMEKYPLLISYPRSGSNWVNCILELYFNRPRLRVGPITFLDSTNKKDYMWFHDHDRFSDLKVNHHNIAYLYRNPPDVIFSLLMAEHRNIFNTDKMTELVSTQINYLKKSLKKYLSTAPICIKYERLKGLDPNVLYYYEFSKIIHFLDPKSNMDNNKLDNAIHIVKKNKIINKSTDKYFSEMLLSNNYEKMREDFLWLFENKINTKIISGELKKFFT